MPPRLRQTAALVLVAVVAFGAGQFVWHARDPASPASLPAPEATPDRAPAEPELPTHLPPLRMKDLDGREQDGAQWNGRVRLINFWATWCGPCREEIPMLIAAQRSHGTAGLQVIGVAMDEAAPVREFQEQFGIDYPLLAGDTDVMEYAARLGNGNLGLPFTVIAGRDGRILYRKLGTLTHEEIDREVGAALAGAVSEKSGNVQ